MSMPSPARCMPGASMTRPSFKHRMSLSIEGGARASNERRLSMASPALQRFLEGFVEALPVAGRPADERALERLVEQLLLFLLVALSLVLEPSVLFLFGLRLLLALVGLRRL